MVAPLTHGLHHPHQFLADPGFGQRVSRALDHVQPPRRPARHQPMRRQGRADHVITALHHGPRDLGDPVQVAQDLPVFLQKAAIGEVMVFQPREGAGIFRRAFAPRPVAVHRGQRVLPRGPGAGIACLDHQIAGKQPPVIGRDHVAAFFLGDQGTEPRPLIRPELPGTAAIEPVDLTLHRQEHTAQRQIGRMLRVRLGIDKGQRRAP